MWQNSDFDPTILTLGTGNNVKGVFVYTDNESIKLQTTKEQYEKQGQWKCYICTIDCYFNCCKGVNVSEELWVSKDGVGFSNIC